LPEWSPEDAEGERGPGGWATPLCGQQDQVPIFLSFIMKKARCLVGMVLMTHYRDRNMRLGSAKTAMEKPWFTKGLQAISKFSILLYNIPLNQYVTQ
jgi:hypothetical protein